jgi:benzylsuccinate CoA-transferase BbsF subunit
VMKNAANEVLEGIKVADFGLTVVGALVTGILASFGAEVIKIESRTNVDYNRQSPPFVEGDGWKGDRSGLWANVGNAGKYGITLNLNHPRGIDIAKKIIARSDIVSENFRGGRMAKWGLGYADLKKIKPDIIMLSASMYGQTGSYATHGGTGGTLIAQCGISNLTGYPEGAPTQPCWVYSDFFIPKMAVLAIMAALDYRRRTGDGQYIDFSQLEAAMHLVVPAILENEVNGRELVRAGNRSDYAAPHGVFRCKGDFHWCAISVSSDDEWHRLCYVMAQPELIQNPKYATLADRLNNVDELESIIEKWTQSYTPQEVMKLLQAAGIPAGVVQNGEDLDGDPQLKSRGYYWDIPHPILGKFSYSGMPAKFSQTPYHMRRSPCFGEHNEYVYTQLLGISDEEFIELLKDGVFE